jgi:hypothetical protein
VTENLCSVKARHANKAEAAAAGAVMRITRISENLVCDECQATVFRVTCMPALVARIINISRLNLPHFPLMRSDLLD